MSRLRCASVFSDHCVLQQGKPIRIWGNAPDNITITVRLHNQMVQTTSHLGKWSVEFPPMKAGGPYVLDVLGEGTDPVHFEDIMIGEVWLAGGQSNMEYKLEQDGDSGEAFVQALTSKVRFFQVPQQAFKGEDFDRIEQDNHWMLPSDENLKIWSAVGYYFAERLADTLGVTVGIIGCNWGGTSACAWQDKESLLSHKETRIYWEEYEELIQKQNPEEYEKEREDYFAWQADWQPKMDAFYAKNPTATWDEAQAVVGISRWPGPMGPKHEFRPCGLYETMLQRVVPYTLGGVIYYQGESDDHRPYTYYHLFKNMIQVWRRDFQDKELPFLCVQLPIHHYLSDTVMDKWCPIRQAQMQLHREGIVTGIAVALDQGEYNNIHPVHKKEVGRRLALQALFHVYQVLPETEVYGPVFRKYEVNGNQMILEFDYADAGFHTTTDTLSVFELAGEDGIFHPAQASIHGHTIELVCPEVPAPNQARYFWTDYADVTLFGANGLPVAPFHTHLHYE